MPAGVVAGGIFSDCDEGILTSCWPSLLGQLHGSPSKGWFGGDGNVWVLDVVYQHKLIDGTLLLATDICDTCKY